MIAYYSENPVVRLPKKILRRAYPLLKVFGHHLILDLGSEKVYLLL
jgi:hypothetical protein